MQLTQLSQVAWRAVLLIMWGASDGSARVLRQLGGEPAYAAEVVRTIASGDLDPPGEYQRQPRQSVGGDCR